MAAPTVPTGVAWRRLVGFNMDISGVPVMGTRMLIVPNATRITGSSTTPKSQIDVPAVEGQYGVDHVLRDAAGNVGVWIVDPNTATLSPTGYNLQVTRIVPGLIDAVYNIDIPVGADGSDVDLADVTPVGANFGVPNVAGPAGASGTFSGAWAGAWDSGTTYTVGALVSENGSTWVSTAATTGDTPHTDAGAHWDLVASAGTDGSGTGDVVGPASATDAHVALFDGTTGKLIKDGGALGTASAVDTGTTSGKIALLGAGGTFTIARLATGTPDGTKFVADDGTLQAPAGGGPLTGTGMPNGVVTGSPGDEYIDTAFTNGARKWLKLTGTATNTGWVCVDGDTGPRDVSSLLKNDYVSGSYGPPTLQRINNLVFLSGSLDTTAATGDSFIDMPAEFRVPTFTILPYFQTSTNSFKNMNCNASGSGATDVAGNTATSIFGVSWATASAWPTGTLPGTAA